MRFGAQTSEKRALPLGPLFLELACWPQIEAYIVENPIVQETELGEYLSHIVGGVCVFGLRF